MKIRTTRRMLSVLLSLLPLGALSAQQATHRPVRGGEVTGVELQLEGALSVRRGTRLRWYLTAYEVRGLDRLRPAAGAELQVATSLAPGRPVTAAADGRGRALVSLEVPDDAPESFGATIRVRTRSGVRRRFDLRVRTREGRALEVYAAPQARAGGRLPVFGRYHRVEGAALADVPLAIEAYDARGPCGAMTVRTDAQGVFTASVAVPRDARPPLRVEVRGPRDEEGRQLRAQTQATLAVPREPPLVVSVAPDRAVVRPGASVPVQVRVRRADGRPVEGARVRLGSRPVPLTDVVPRDDLVRTDARGRATLRYRAPRRLDAGYFDLSIDVQAAKAGVGQGGGSARLRVSAEAHHTALAVEGGALVPNLRGRVFVEVVDAYGRRVGPGVSVHLEGPRVGRHELTTDGSGVAVAEVEVGPRRDGDRCGGDAMTAVQVQVGDGTVVHRCVPVDADAAVALRASRVLAAPEEVVQFEVERVAAASQLPVAVVAFVPAAEGLMPVGAQVLGPRQSTLRLEIPADTPPGLLLVRARPLVGAEQVEARGGFAAIRVVPEPELATELRVEGGIDRLALHHELQGEVERSSVAVVWPLEAGSFALPQAALDDGRGGRRTPSIAALEAARRTPTDLAAPVRLRGRDRSPAPAPADPERLGLLRDPWRASARFIEGRLALVFRAIEARVDAAVPDAMEDVAARERGRYRFNRQILASLTDGSLGAQGATGLGGEPLTIERLEALDRAFDYDHVAMRVTRRRLFKVLLALRAFVKEKAFDLAWARPGDPRLWLEQLRQRVAPGMGILRPGELVDGWGRPFELRPTRRPRFDRLQPVAGYELVSAGPDGRFGNRDDLVDPTARVLPRGSLYGRAVGEDALVARLGGVELGRATLALAREVFSAPPLAVPAPQERPRAELGALPSLLEPDPWALALRRPTKPADARLVRVEEEGSVPVDTEPRTWRVAIVSYTRRGTVSVATGGARGGAPVLADLALPSHLRVGEPLEFTLHLTDATDAGASVTLRGRGEGVRVEVVSEMQLEPGRTRAVPVALTAHEAGGGQVTVEVASVAGELLRAIRRRVRVVRGQHPIRRRASMLLGARDVRVDLSVPAGARGRLLVVSPRALTADPDMAELWRDDPALVAWSETLAGRRLDPVLRARVLRAQEPAGLVRGQEPALSTAAAITALSALFDERGRPDEEARLARQRAVSRLRDLPSFADRDPKAGSLRMQAAVLAALATSGVSESDPSIDPVGELLRSRLPSLRRALRDVPGEPSLLARCAAALLLADPRDGHARAMFRRVRAALEPAPGGLRLAPSPERDGTQESLHATLAAAIAAHQLGEAQVARELLGYAARQAPDIARSGGEAAFWWFAAAAYGAFGDAPRAVEVFVDGRPQSLSLTEGSASIPLPAGGERHIRAAGGQGPALLRAEAIFARAFAARQDAPLRLALNGEAGAAGTLAAVELSVVAQRAVGMPVVDVQLPAGVEPDDALLRRLEASAAVRRAEAREPGFLRLWLAPMAAEAELTIPLTLRWQAVGTVRGLALVAYAADRPDRMTVVPPRTWTIAPLGRGDRRELRE